MKFRFLVETTYRDRHVETDCFDSEDDAMQRSRFLLRTRGGEIRVLDVLRQEWSGDRCLHTATIKHVQ